MAWEQLAHDMLMPQATAQLNVFAQTISGRDLRYAVLLPPNVTRGAVTMLRLRGDINVIYQNATLAAAGGQAQMTLPLNIQLAPVRDGAIVNLSVLDPENLADMESNRVIWRRNCIADLNDASGVTVNTVRHYQMRGPTTVDVKSKRRFDRANWALILVGIFEQVQFSNTRMGVDLRGLFLAPDGL